MRRIFVLFILFLIPACVFSADLQASMETLERELVARYGEAQKARLQRGMKQVAGYWREEDGDPAAFEEFVRTHFAGDQDALDTVFHRFEFALEQLDGHLLEINREFRKQSDLDLGPILPIDEILSAYDPTAHGNDDFFANQLAFVALLNFPLTTLQERLANGEKWTRKEWAEARLAQRFSVRVPAEVNLKISETTTKGEKYISQYNIWMHHLLDGEGNRLFPPKLRLITHWNLRDELKAAYSDPNGLPKQKMIQTVMERIVTQTIPEVVVNNPHVDWNPVTNEVMPASVQDSEDAPPEGMNVTNRPEPDTRYEILLNNYRAMKLADPYFPVNPTLMDRKFNEEREIPETRMKEMLTAITGSPLVPRVASLIEQRLGRSLEPFDIWYNGFRPRAKYTEAELDAITKKKYPTAEAFERDIPEILVKLGFSKEKAAYLADRIVVDPSRGAGHAMGAQRRGDKAHLRTRVEKDGMNYKGYNIAVHELGHNVEQTFSLYDIDSYLLNGVPNTAFTEALAFVFQGRDLELLGLSSPDAGSEALSTLNDFWSTYEIAGVALVDMEVWHWMYDHPDATPAQLKEAVIGISREIWNRYYAPVFKKKDVVLLGIYSHMIQRQLYLPDYPIGHLIAFQVEEQMEEAGNIGSEFERITRTGRVTPDYWMKTATGAPVGPEALLRATGKALDQLAK